MNGILLASIAAFFLALYIVPRKFSKLPTVDFNMLMGLGFFVGSIAVYVVSLYFGNQESLTNPSLLLALFGGLLFAIGLMSLVKSIDMIGLARSNQWKNLQGPIGVVLSLFVLHEANTVNPIFAILSGIAIFLAAILFNVRSNVQIKSYNLNGIYYALLAAVMFGFNSLIGNYVSHEAGVFNQNICLSFGILLSLVLYKLLTNNFKMSRINSHRELIVGLSSGLLYLGASTFLLLSFKAIEASIAFTIVQMNFIVVVGIGIFIFKEIPFRPNLLRISLGIIFATIGVILLTLSK